MKAALKALFARPAPWPVRRSLLAPRRLPLAPSARRAVLAGLFAYALLHVGFALWLDYGPPRVRDPEYGKRLAAVRGRVADHSGRPLVLCVGSSRTAMGVRPGVLADRADAPLLVNFALAGSGPVMELMALRRAIADGVKPAAVLVEYWPAFLHEEGGYHEDARIDAARLSPADRPLVRDYFRDPAKVDRALSARWLNPWFEHRHSLMNQLSPGWLPYHRRSEALWDKIDGWGWLPGREGATPAERVSAEAAAAGYYRPLFAQFTVSAVADRALRQTLAECRERGIPVALLYLPESATFRGYMPPAAQALADGHLATIVRDTGVPLIDARGWVSDEALPDGFHLTQAGAAVVTRRLADAVAETLPGSQPR